jgi:hypothetical protein
MTKDKKYRWGWLILLDRGILLVGVAQVGIICKLETRSPYFS